MLQSLPVIGEQVKAVLRRHEPIVKLAHRLNLRSQAGWLYRRNVLTWITEHDFTSQLPPLYQLYARYCRLWIGHTQASRVPAAEALLALAIRMQGVASRPQLSTRIRFPSLEAYLNLEDPRFLAVGKELLGGQVLATLSQFLRPGDTFVDVGANQGAYSLLAAALVGPKGRLIAIEPQPELAKNLEKSLRANSVRRFEVHAVAVGDQEGKAELIVPKTYSGAAGLYREHSGLDGHRTVEVPLRRFDTLVESATLPGSVFIKLDVEEAELAFLRGGRRLLEARRPQLLMEINPRALAAAKTNKGDLVDLLGSYGYTSYRVLNQGADTRALRDLELDRFHNIVVSADATA